MKIRKIIAYFMILIGVIMEFLTFRICSELLCYYSDQCEGFSVECLAGFFVASLLLVIGGLYILKFSKNNKYI